MLYLSLIQKVANDDFKAFPDVLYEGGLYVRTSVRARGCASERTGERTGERANARASDPHPHKVPTPPGDPKNVRYNYFF